MWARLPVVKCFVEVFPLVNVFFVFADFSNFKRSDWVGSKLAEFKVPCNWHYFLFFNFILNLKLMYKTNVLLFIFNSYKYHRMQPKDIRINKVVADKIKIVNYAHQNSIHMAADKYGVETKSIRNWKKQLPCY